jgi:hypothetical protein
MNISELHDALSAALHALSAAQATLRKSLPGRSIDVLSKATAAPKDDPSAEALAKLADAGRRLERLEAAKDYDAQHRKTFPRDEVER